MARVRPTTDSEAPARSDAYVGLLLISLLAQIAGVVFFYLDWSQYESAKPKVPPAATVPAVPAPGAGNPPAGGGGGLR